MDNITYIRNWFLANNKFLTEEDRWEDILDILVCYTVAFEKLAGINDDDDIIVRNRKISFKSGPLKRSDEMDLILNGINSEYGYCKYDELSQTRMSALIRYENVDGVLSDDLICAYLKKKFDRQMRNFKRRNYNLIVYKINDMIFFSDQPLSEEEMQSVKTIKYIDQRIFEVRHKEGRMFIW